MTLIVSLGLCVLIGLLVGLVSTFILNRYLDVRLKTNS